MRAYGQAKLANILFTYELAHRLADSGVTANALHPGFVASNFAKNNGWVVRVAMRIVHLFAISPEQGAQTSLYLASSPEVEGITGKYFVDCKPVPSSPASYNQDTAQRLWQVSEALTGLNGS
jgi:NAD(P)-dependent dehydrogenase (short-subunit alcohol dehydrogenase family)